jgi:hypothetical protein
VVTACAISIASIDSILLADLSALVCFAAFAPRPLDIFCQTCDHALDLQLKAENPSENEGCAGGSRTMQA